jgi:tetratricopeptide (TPR) repeat protein
VRWWVVIAALVLPASQSALAQSIGDARFDSLAKRGIDHVYNLEFESAQEDFNELVRREPHNPAGHFFLAMVDWWKILIDLDNEERDKKFFEDLDHVTEMCDSMLEGNENDVAAIFFKGGAVGFQGRLKFHRNDYLAAANAGRKALPLVQTASSLDPNNYDILLGTGIYNYYAEVIPSEFPFVKPLMLFIPPGDKKKGIEQLTAASEKGKFASVEAAYFLLQIYFFYEKDYGKALGVASSLSRRYPNNMLFHRYLGRSYAAALNWPMADEVFAEIVARSRRGQRGYSSNAEREAEYYLGASAMAGGRNDEALTHFIRCDELSRTLDKSEASGFMAMANLKIGNIFDLQGKRDLAMVQYDKVATMKDYKDSSTLARQYQKTPYAH